jgi:hypothetical protein
MKKAKRGPSPSRPFRYDRKLVTVGVFLGGSYASETTALKLAESMIEEKLGESYDFRYKLIYTEDLWSDVCGHADLEHGTFSIAKTTPWDFANNLRSCDIHLILSNSKPGRSP